jgi:hypothetical protein
LIDFLYRCDSVATSANGWTDDAIGAEWLEKSFIPQATRRNKSQKPILLILDGHSSHETLKFIDLAEENNIIVLCLPPHTTHKLQPLDVGVFGPFQRAWIDRCDSVVELIGSEMPKEEFIKQYMDVRNISFKSITIISAFKKSGIWPINRAVFMKEDYAPSIPYSTEAHDFPALLSDDRDDSQADPDSDSDADESESQRQTHDCTATMTTPSTRAHSHQPLALPSPPSAETETPSLLVPTNSYEPVHPGPPAPPPCHCSQSRLVLISSAIPPQQFYHNPGLFARMQYLEERVEKLTAHAKMSDFEGLNLKRKLNHRTGQASKRRKLNVEARVLTSVEGRQLAEEKDAERTAKEQKKKDAEQRRKEKEVERIQHRLNRPPDAPFTGSLGSKNRPDLQEIAGALGLPETGTKEALTQSIKAHFDSNLSLRDLPRFSGLFNRATRRRPRELENQLSMPVASTSQNTLPQQREPLSTNLLNTLPTYY